MKSAILVGLISLLIGLGWGRYQIFRSSHHSICELVAARSLFNKVNIHAWFNRCIQSESEVGWFTTKRDMLNHWQDLLNEVGVSHLNVYGPVEDKKLWQGRAKEVGLRAWTINGRFIVSDVFAGSPAERAGVKVGDQILRVGGEPIYTADQVSYGQGEYELVRDGENIEVNLVPEEISIDQSPNVKALNEAKGYGLLKISSFRAGYFEAKKWKQIVNEFKRFDSLVIDLRDNSGGNFVAMLRAVSPFVCEPKDLGRLFQPRREDERAAAFEDNILDQYQIAHIENYREVPLKPFISYGCYQGEVKILVNRRTSSVSEIFASALREAQDAEIIGEQTAGDVVVAIWYSIPHFGPGYTISIPEAIYETSTGESLEGKGLEVDTPAFYKLTDALKGQDSWIQHAIQ